MRSSSLAHNNQERKAVHGELGNAVSVCRVADSLSPSFPLLLLRISRVEAELWISRVDTMSRRRDHCFYRTFVTRRPSLSHYLARTCVLDPGLFFRFASLRSLSLSLSGTREADVLRARMCKNPGASLR